MKLLPQSETPGPALPEDLDERLPWYEQELRRLAARVFSRHGFTVTIGLLLTIVLSGILSITYVRGSRFVNENGIGIAPVYADHTFDVMDNDATQRQKDYARQNVQLIYKDANPINQSVEENMAKTIDTLAQTMTDPRQPWDQKRQVFTGLLGNTPLSRDTVAQLQHLRTATTEAYWKGIHARADEVAQRILKKGLNVGDYHDKREAIIRDNMPDYAMSRLDAGLVYLVLNQTLQPNQVVDTEAMTHEQDRVASLVTPVKRTFHANEVVVEQGKPVTAVEQAALQQMGKNGSGNNWLGVLGVFLLTSVLTATLWTYLYNFNGGQYFRPSYATLLFTMLIITIVTFRFIRHMNSEQLPIPAYIFPLGALSLIITILMHPRFGLLVTTMAVFLLGLTLKADFVALSVLFFGSMMGVYVIGRRLHFSDRGHLMFAGVYIGLINALGIIAITLMDPVFDVSYQDDWQKLLFAIGWGIGGGVLSGMLTIGALPFLEVMFRLVSPYTLMELSNHDHPLLKRMQFESPGTFHHSLMVASLAEAAAEAIGANTLLTRVGCLYHDIGKMKRPLFFIENQAYFGSENPHDKLTPRLSKLVITAHPRDSLEMARQYRLPEIIQSFMTEHHGTLVAGYFYNKACQEEGVENVNKSHFRYAGPKPQTRETAVVMLADACESATRAMKSPTVQQIEERIDKIIAQRVEDGQFDNCPITFKDIHTIRETFLRVLRGIQHNRIEYQQNIMRDLGRKVGKPAPVPQAPTQESIDKMVSDLKKAEGENAAAAPASTTSPQQDNDEGGCEC